MSTKASRGTKLDPLADRPDIPKSEVRYNADTTIRLVLTGKVVWLRPPTVGELEDLVLARNVIAEEVLGLQDQITDINKATVAYIADTAAALEKNAPAPDLPENRTGEANALVAQQRRAYATFWAEKIIPLLAMSTVDVKADDLPAFMGAGQTMGSAFEAWYAGPTVPGDD